MNAPGARRDRVRPRDADARRAGRHFLWSDLAPVARRAHMTQDAFAAIGLALERHWPLEGDARAFRALRDAFELVAAPHRDRVWRDPQTYFWIRRAYQLVATCIGCAELPRFDAAYVAELAGGDVTAALRRHLAELARLVVGAHLVARRTLQLATPHHARLPVAVPGTGVVLVGDGVVRIHGVARGRVVASRDGATVELAPGGRARAGMRLVRAPIVRVGDAAIVMQPEMFAWPSLPFGDDIARVGNGYQRAHASLLRSAVALVRRHQPRTFRMLARTVRMVALKPRAFPDFANLSHSELPGAIVCSRVADHHVLAAGLVHEVHHHRLFLLEEASPIFDRAAGDAFEDARFYSPWRDDPRPLQGVLHALYVYVPVLRFWRAVARSAAPDSLLGALVRDRLVRIPEQLRLGVVQLRRHARLTRYGARLFTALADEVTALGRRGSLDVPAVRISITTSQIVPETDGAGAPMTVREALAAHLALGSPPHGCAPADLGW